MGTEGDSACLDAVCLPTHRQRKQGEWEDIPSVPWGWKRARWPARGGNRVEGLTLALPCCGPTRRGLQAGRGEKDDANVERTETRHFISKRKPIAAVSQA